MNSQDQNHLRSIADEAFERDGYAEAEKLFRQVLTYLEVTVADNTIEFAKTLECLARTLEGQGRKDEALMARHRADRIYTSST